MSKSVAINFYMFAVIVLYIKLDLFSYYLTWSQSFRQEYIIHTENAYNIISWRRFILLVMFTSIDYLFWFEKNVLQTYSGANNQHQQRCLQNENVNSSDSRLDRQQTR